jgi:hypothetical protein
MNEWEEVKDCRECREEVNKVWRVLERGLPLDRVQLMVTVVSRIITVSSRGIIEATRSIYL